MMNQESLHVSHDEDEIDLRELFITIKKYLKEIFLFVGIVVSITLMYVLSLPNSYQTSTVLAPQSQGKSSLGGLSALAGMAGIDIGGSSDVSTADYLSTILKDYNFNVMIIKKYDLINKIDGDDKNFVFALGFRGLYDLFHFDKSADTQNEEAQLFNTYKKLDTIISFSADKKSGMINLSATSPDRILAKELVEIYLAEVTSHLRTIDMQDTDQKIAFYRDEMAKKDDVELKKNLATLVSSLIQKSVLAKSSEYYLVKPITKPEMANIKDKTKPKRALILIVSFVTAFILGIFAVFFYEFIKNTKNEN